MQCKLVARAYEHERGVVRSQSCLHVSVFVCIRVTDVECRCLVIFQPGVWRCMTVVHNCDVCWLAGTWHCSTMLAVQIVEYVQTVAISS
jgi:hypothetical protein